VGELTGVWVVVGLGTLYHDRILDPGNCRPRGGGPREWGTVGVAVMLSTVYTIKLDSISCHVGEMYIA